VYKGVQALTIPKSQQTAKCGRVHIGG